jgi:hypothetical protein
MHYGGADKFPNYCRAIPTRVQQCWVHQQDFLDISQPRFEGGRDEKGGMTGFRLLTILQNHLVHILCGEAGHLVLCKEKRNQDQ